MAELWELVDINKKKTGVIHERGKENCIPHGMYHMVVDIWVKNLNGEILLTQRSPKKSYGLLWECSGGSVILGEKCEEAARRELFEETGIKANENELIYLGDTVSSYWITETYLYKINAKDINLKLQEEEVVDAIWISPEHIESKKDIMVDSVWKRYCRYKDVINNI